MCQSNPFGFPKDGVPRPLSGGRESVADRRRHPDVTVTDLVTAHHSATSPLASLASLSSLCRAAPVRRLTVACHQHQQLTPANKPATATSSHFLQPITCVIRRVGWNVKDW